MLAIAMLKIEHYIVLILQLYFISRATHKSKNDYISYFWGGGYHDFDILSTTISD